MSYKLITPETLLAELLARTDVRGPDECHPWIGTLDRDGYGRIKVFGKQCKPHRLIYVELGGVLSDAETIDHTCHDPIACKAGDDCLHRRCMNTAHMVPTTNADNAMRGNGPPARFARAEFCIRGHEFRPRADGSGRYCPTCKWLRWRGLI